MAIARRSFIRRSLAVLAGAAVFGTSFVAGREAASDDEPTASSNSDAAAALVEKGVLHVKLASITYSQWLNRSYAPGVREKTQWARALAAFDGAVAALRTTTSPTTTAPPPTTTAPPPGTTTTTTTTTPTPPASFSVAPGQSWQAAYLAAKPGQVISVKPGLHPMQELKRDPSKDGATQRVIFQGGPGVSVSGFRSGASGGTGNTRGADHFELRDIDVQGVLRLIWTDDVVAQNIGDGDVTPSSGRNSFVISSSTNVTVRGGEFGPWVNGINHISRCGSNPVCPPGGNILLDGVVLHDFLIDNPAPHSECLMIWGTQTAGVTIRNSILRNCTDFSVLVKAPGATRIVFENSYFDKPMPGDRATTECNPGCPRGGNSIRFNGATELFTGSRVTGNIVNGGIGVDCKCVPVSGNAAGTIPARP